MLAYVAKRQTFLMGRIDYNKHLAEVIELAKPAKLFYQLKNLRSYILKFCIKNKEGLSLNLDDIFRFFSFFILSTF